ncbi:MAG: hypothetical protein M0027_13490, partial [Candidatus Dormibacteraeota bacterium]|nr:hypothetical protein [Candidatus Dormibacteraeota bacterium]
MSFFDEEHLPTSAQIPRRGARPPWAGPPDNVLPAPFGDRLLMGQSEQAAVAVFGAQACATGFGVDIVAKWRQPGRPEPVRHGLYFDPRRGPDALRFEIHFADGRVARGANPGEDPSDPDPRFPRLSPQHGFGSNGQWVQHMWVWPLPPPGPITFVCAWPVLGISETQAIVDADAILAAAAGATPLWPDDAGGIGFAASRVSPQVRPEWVGPPDNVIPGALPLELLLAASETAVVALRGRAAYPTGFEFDLVARVKALPSAEEPNTSQFLVVSPEEITNGKLPPRFLRFGLEFSDGRKVTNLPGAGPGPIADPGRFCQDLWKCLPAGQLRFTRLCPPW